MVLPTFLSKPSKKRSESNISKENRKPSSRSSRSPTKRSPSKSPLKSAAATEQYLDRKGAGRSARPHQYPADTHPLNLPPEERERRLSAMSGVSEPLSPMDIDRDGASLPSSPANNPQEAPRDPEGPDAENGINGDSSPVPPPHSSNFTTLPPKPAIDPEICKAVGNKYFKAKDYQRAIQEYSKGTDFLMKKHSSSRLSFLIQLQLICTSPQC